MNIFDTALDARYKENGYIDREGKVKPGFTLAKPIWTVSLDER